MGEKRKGEKTWWSPAHGICNKLYVYLVYLRFFCSSAFIFLHFGNRNRPNGDTCVFVTLLALVDNTPAMFSRCASLSSTAVRRQCFTANNSRLQPFCHQSATTTSRTTPASAASVAGACRRIGINLNATKVWGRSRSLLQRSRYFSTGGKPSSTNQTFLQRWMAPKEMPPRWTLRWYGEMVLICTVFGITGTSTMVLVRPAVSDVLGLKGSFKQGPWSYRICSLVIMTPVYATLLVCVGTIFGRHSYFRFFAVKMFSRFGIPPEMMDETYHITKKTFRKN